MVIPADRPTRRCAQGTRMYRGDNGRMKTFGFLGLGTMGAPMAENLAAAVVAGGDQLLVWNRTAGRDVTVCRRGGERVTDPVELVGRCDVVIMMLPDLAQINELSFGAPAVLREPVNRTVLVVCSSVSPDAIREYGERVYAQTAGLVTVVDAPVSGGPEGAADASLAIMVGGDDESIAVAWPALLAMGQTVRHLGPLGAGSLAKACNQMVVAATMIALSEACTMAEFAGLDVDALLTVLAAGYAGSQVLDAKREYLLHQSYPARGKARYMLKDLDSVARESARLALSLAQSALSHTLFADVVAADLGDQDMSVVHQMIRRQVAQRATGATVVSNRYPHQAGQG